jgi:hypothetical protein
MEMEVEDKDAVVRSSCSSPPLPPLPQPTTTASGVGCVEEEGDPGSVEEEEVVVVVVGRVETEGTDIDIFAVVVAHFVSCS